MSTSTATRRTRPQPAARSRRKRPQRGRALRRRLAFLLAVAFAAVVVGAAIAPWADKAVQEVSLPLRHEDIIRQQAAEKGIDPPLIAGVIFAESHFRDQTSAAGAKGLMQIMPDTAEYIADKSGGTAFVQGDLATPQVNIAYGSWYLRYLLQKYDGDEVLALAAYNAGEGKVDEWLAAASARGEEFNAAEHIPFAETRAYVVRVLEARERYRETYARELGL
jgi:soluble lytic murein transglycosylase